MKTEGSVALLYGKSRALHSPLGKSNNGYIDSLPELLSWKTCQRLMIEFIVRVFLVPYYLSSILLFPCYIMTATLIVVCENIAALFN